jgi:hypothetical protein
LQVLGLRLHHRGKVKIRLLENALVVFIGHGER